MVELVATVPGGNGVVAASCESVGAKEEGDMNSTRQHIVSVVLPVQAPLVLPRSLNRAVIERLSPSDYAIYLAVVRARQRLSRQGRRNDPVAGTRPSGGYQTVTVP